MKKQSQQFILKLTAIIVTICFSMNSMGQDKIIRKQLLTADIGTQTVKKVDMREINFQPLQRTGYHQHPCPVVGYIVSGTVLFQVEGDSSKTLKAGDAFFEPMNKPMVHFDNLSSTEPLKFIAYYLLNDGSELIQMLSPKTK